MCLNLCLYKVVHGMYSHGILSCVRIALNVKCLVYPVLGMYWKLVSDLHAAEPRNKCRFEFKAEVFRSSFSFYCMLRVLRLESSGIDRPCTHTLVELQLNLLLSSSSSSSVLLNKIDNQHWPWETIFFRLRFWGLRLEQLPVGSTPAEVLTSSAGSLI